MSVNSAKNFRSTSSPILIDLTHTFTAAMPVFPEDTSPEFTRTATLEKEGYVQYRIKTGMHVGTHLDAPMHMVEGGKGVAELPIDRFFGRGTLLDARGASTIDLPLFDQLKGVTPEILLILTGLAKKFGTPEYFESYPVLTEPFAERVVEMGIKMIGLDSPSPDRAPYPVHRILLKNEVLILENLKNLEVLVGPGSFELIALPPKFATDGAPVRVVARSQK